MMCPINFPCLLIYLLLNSSNRHDAMLTSLSVCK